MELGQNDFLQFKEKLTNFFKTYPGAIFDAEHYRHFAGAGQEKSPRVFELASGQQKRHFLSFWALLQERDIFSETTQNLAKIAGAIREHTAFKTIVTCTTSSRYLMEYLHSDLEISENHKVDIRYFGPFPYHVVEGSDLQDLRDHRVLILTDVINSGSLAAHLASVVRQLGGEIAAILAIAVVNPDFCLIAPRTMTARNSYTPQYRLLPVGPVGEKLPVYNIVDIPLANSPSIHPLNQVIKIDPISVFPVNKTMAERDAEHRAVIPDEKAIAILEAAKAISVNFFQAEQCRYTYAVRIHNILNDEAASEHIWANLQKEIPRRRDVLFVTTFDKGCLSFSDFVTRKINGGGRHADILRVPYMGEFGGAAYPFIQNETRRIEKRTVVLLLGVVHTSERLRSLVALLARARPREIISIAFLDRMDTSSSAFVPRVRELSAEVNFSKRRFMRPTIPFSTLSVFSLRDFGTNDIARMQEMVARLLTGFGTWCQTISFKILTEHDQKYFAPHKLSGYEFQSYALPQISTVPEHAAEGQESRPNSTEAYLVKQIMKVVRTRTYKPLFELMESVDDKSVLYRVAAFILIDISYLRGTGDFSQLRDLIIERLRSSRYARCQREISSSMENPFTQAERAQIKAAIRSDVLVESYLIFCLALLAFLDTKYNYMALLDELMLNAPAEDFEELLNSAPLNAIVYVQEARILWSLTFLAYLTDRQFRETKSTSTLNKSMLAQAVRLSIWLTRKLADDTEHEQEIRAAISSLDDLRSELGEYTLHRYHEMIRLLHKQLVLQPPQHNPARTTLYSIRDELVNQFDQGRAGEGSISIVGAANQREVQGRIEQGWFQLSVLQRMGQAAAELFSTTELAINSLAPERFLPGYQANLDRGRKLSPFEDDVRHLSEILLKTRQSNVMHSQEVQTFSEVLDRVDGDLWSFGGTPLLKSLCHFIQPLDVRIKEALFDAAQNLQAHAHGQELAQLLQSATFENFPEGEPCFVLCELGLLSEVFRNIFTNIRHAYQEGVRLPPVRIRSIPPDGGAATGSLDVMESTNRYATIVEIWTPGDASQINLDRDQSPSTLTRHKAELQDYAADLRVQSGDRGEGVISRLSFRSRNLHVARLRKEWESRDEESKRRFAGHIFFRGRSL